METCSACGKGAVSIEYRPDAEKFKEVTYVARTPWMVCDHCGEADIWANDLHALELAAARRYILDGHRGADGHRQCRHIIGMGRRAIAEQYGLTLHDIIQAESHDARPLDEKHWSILLGLIRRACRNLRNSSAPSHLYGRMPQVKVAKK
jgi:hypothetical protein